MSITYSVLASLVFFPVACAAQDSGRGARPLTSQEELKQAPKEVTFNFVKEEGSQFSMDRLEGERVELQGTERKYTSTPIRIENSRGSCRIDSVPPGRYKLTMAVLRLETSISVREKASRSVVFQVTIGNQLEIREVN